MSMRRSLPLLVGIAALLLRVASAAQPAERYQFITPHDPDGIGKFYLGREIAQVMGHQGADWLERPERVAEEHPDDAIRALRLKGGERVADIGAGTGYFAWRLARAVGPSGRVYAVDIQQEMLDLMAGRLRARGVTNVVGTLGTAQDPKLPDGTLDLVLMVDVYHEFEFPYEMMEATVRSLKPGGRVAFIEYRGEDSAVPIKPLHKMTEAQLKKEMAVLPLAWEETIATLPRQHLLVFRKQDAAR